jgi:hypothetical protein
VFTEPGQVSRAAFALSDMEKGFTTLCDKVDAIADAALVFVKFVSRWMRDEFYSYILPALR